MESVAKSTSLNPRKKRVQLAILGALVATLCGYVLWPMLFRRSLAADATSYRDCFFAADVECLYRSAPEWERSQFNLSHAQIERIRKEFLLPKLSGIKIVKSLPGVVDSLGGTGRDVSLVKLQKGKVIEWNTFADLTDEGSRYMFRQVFNHGMEIGYLNDHNCELDRYAMAASITEGLHRDRPLLESIGLKGYSGRYPGEPFQTWSMLEEHANMFNRLVHGRKRN